MKRLRILLSNDDGIDSPFLSRFLEAFSESGAEVLALVPACEQSWIGRAYSRHKKLTLKSRGKVGGAECFTVDGTPSDCVNIALGHLFEGGDFPDAVVSGLNIGQNLGLPLLWSSGTFSAAAEGAAWGLPSFAFSQQLASEYYEICRLKHSPAPEALDKILKASAKKSAEIVSDFLSAGALEKGVLCNVNFPLDYSEDCPLKRTVPAMIKMRSLYRREGEDSFACKYAIGEPENKGLLTDMDCLKNSWASYSLVKIADF